jgi:hypothetical protein
MHVFTGDTNITFNGLGQSGIIHYAVRSFISKKMKKEGTFMKEIFHNLLIINSNSSNYN